ncbi:hypothetical protein [Bacillus mycoides]|uniref:hypothetical protein n=1 Tax=Bacillus mycoides TaxID=1405 RepID=UPI003557CC69
MIKDVGQFISNYYHYLLDVEVILLIITTLMILSIFLKSRHILFVGVVWIYSALIPAATIIFLNYNPHAYLEIIFLILQGIFIFLYMKSITKNYELIVANTSNPLSKISKIINKDYGKEKSLEYVGLFILPFITVNNTVNILTIIVIICIVVTIIKRFELFYLNLPLLLFFKIELIETNRRVQMMVLTPRDFSFEIGEEYDVRSFIKTLNLYIYIPKKNS